jgi:glycosyltransferase involved in cell wall biosynthesis
MRVVVNYSSAAEKARTGVGHYTRELVGCLREQAGPGVIDVFPGIWGQRAHAAWMEYRRVRMPPPAGLLSGDAPVRPTLRSRVFDGVRACGRLARHMVFQQVCRWEKYDLYHEPNFLPFPVRCPTVVTLHDLSPLLHPEWHPMDRVIQFERCFRRGLDQCVHVLTVSEFVRREVIDTLNLSPERVTRTYNGIRRHLAPLSPEEVATVLAQLKLPAGYLLHVGTIEPRKNVLMLLRAYTTLPDDVRTLCPLLLVGNWGWNSARVADYLHNEARHRGVLYRQYVAEEHLPALYNGARALVFPSLYEGFGLPPVEMLACGGAVLASTAGAVAEVVGRHAHLLDPHDIEAWRNAMRRVIQDEDWWKSLRQGGVEVARPFTWEGCAAGTLAVYRSLCGEEKRLNFAA